MKKLATLFSFVGFAIQYILPIVIFGDIVPFTTTKEAVGRCLTGMGYIAIALALFFVLKKVKEWILQKPKSIKRALLLSVPPIVWWVAIFIGLDYLSSFMLTFANYWNKVILFILLGRGCYVVSEALASGEEGAKS
jgi:hypothetical protein